MWRNTIKTALVEVGLPVTVYLVASGVAGVEPVWALVLSAGVSVVVLAGRWWRTRELSTLGLLVLVQFALGVAVAGVTGDPRLVLLKDYVVTAFIALAAGASLVLSRPFIARVRRDLSPDRADFDRRWESEPAFRRVHRRLTVLWVVGLLTQALVAAVLIYTLPLTAAVVATNVLTPAVLVALISTTEVRAARVAREPLAS